MCVPGAGGAVGGQAGRPCGARLGRRALFAAGAGAVAASALPASAHAPLPASALPASAHAPLPVPAGAAQADPAWPAGSATRRRSRDLTHLLTEQIPVFTFDPPARETIATIPADGYYAQRWRLAEHAGTHMDAPGHFIEGGRLAPEVTPGELIVPIAVVDIAQRAVRDPDAVVTVDDLVRFERRHGRIPDGALVCMNSGWAAKVGDPLAYKGGASFPDYHFPGFDLDAAMWLAERRDVAGIGVDTLSLDPGNSTTFPVHLEFLATDRYGLENLNNLDRIPPNGALAYVGLIPFQDGSGGPCRVIATW